MTGKFLTIVVAGALVAGAAGVALAQSSGRTLPPGQRGLRATHALNMLEHQGYTQIADFSRAGKNFTADVTKNGKTFEVLVDQSTGQIQPQIAGNGATGGNM
jgi:hypothetical protein